jgi:flagella basal body P-ring formation protein FlgA
MRRVLTLIVPLLLAPLLLAATPALAGSVSLKADTVDADGRVTLGDLFDGAGAAAGVVVAMRPGPTAVLDAAAVQAAARRAGLEWSQQPRACKPHRGAWTGADAGPQAAASRALEPIVEVLTWARSLDGGRDWCSPRTWCGPRPPPPPAGAPEGRRSR